MIPFITDVLEGMIRKLVNLFIRKEVLTEANTQRTVIKIGVADVKNRLPVEMVSLSTAVKAFAFKSGNIWDKTSFEKVGIKN